MPKAVPMGNPYPCLRKSHFLKKKTVPFFPGRKPAEALPHTPGTEDTYIIFSNKKNFLDFYIGN